VRIIIASLLLASRIAAAEVSAVDSDGRRITLASPAQRIVSLAPHVTEQLFAAGAGGKIIAASEYSDYPPEATRLPRVASSGAVDVEAVLALKADLVVAWRLEATAKALQRLESLGVTVFYNEPRRLAQIAGMLEAMGELAGTSATARRLAASLRQELARLESAYRTRRQITLFYQIAEKPLMTLSREHFVSDAIALCGGRNVFADAPIIASVVNIEAVLAADPEAVITARVNPADNAWQAAWRRFPGLRAVQAGNLYAVPVDEMHRHGPRAVAATRELCERIDDARRKTHR
jgi:iron complex transport system substrate-binding protein